MKLCYIEGPWAYFTTAKRQWGDDWNDAPYEHNAGRPYDWRESSTEEPYTIRSVAFDGPFQTPAALGLSVSVQDINEERFAWLTLDRFERVPEGYSGATALMGGASLEEFCRFVEALGGTVYEPRAAASTEEGRE